MRHRAAGIAAGIDGHTGLASHTDPVPAPGIKITHVRGVHRVSRCRSGEFGEILDVDQCGHQRGAALGHHGNSVLGQSGAVFDAVDAGCDQARQCILAKHMRGHPGTLGMGGGDGGDKNIIGPQGRKVPRGAVDPIADEFHPAVTAPGLFGQRLRELPFVFEFDGVTLQISLGSRQMPSSPDDLR